MDYNDLASMTSSSPMINYRKDAKKAVKFSFMVAGESGTGKSTFINCLLNRKVMNHKYEGVDASGETKTLAYTSAQNVNLPNASILATNEFDASAAQEEPGIALTETKVEIVDDDGIRMQLSIIDTPGFGENLNNEMCYVEIENFLKQQFDLVLAEETRIKRNPRFVDTRVHCLLYFITPTGHGLRDLDIATMKRLSKYVNIIPVVGRADSFTLEEIQHFKQQIKIDIERFNVPVFQFDNFVSEYDEAEDYDLIQECKFLTRLQPFAIIASEQDFEIKDTNTGETKVIKARQYPWGLVDVNNPKYSDFPVLKSVLLGSHLQDLKDLTHDFLYETYRTERLTGVTGKSAADEDEDTFHDSTDAPQGGVTNAVPSLSNLAKLTDESAFKLDQDKDDSDDNTSLLLSLSKKPRSMLLNEESNQSPKVKENASFTSSVSSVSDRDRESQYSHYERSNNSFKRLSIGPQRSQLRQISETVPYVIRHERILERQHKLEEMEQASARELANRALTLEQRAAALKAKEKLLLEKLDAYKKKQAAASETTSVNTEVAEGEGEQETLQTFSIRKDETLTDLHLVVSQK